MDAYNVGLKDKFNTLKNNAKEKADGLKDNLKGLKDNLKDKLPKKNNKTPDSSSTTEKNPEPPSSITPASNYDSLTDLGKAVVEMLSGGGLGNGKWSLTKHYEICDKYGVSYPDMVFLEEKLGAYPLYDDRAETQEKREKERRLQADIDFENSPGVQPDQKITPPSQFGTIETYDNANEQARKKMVEEGSIEGGDDFRPTIYERYKAFDEYPPEYWDTRTIEGKDKSAQYGLGQFPNLKYKMWKPEKGMIEAAKRY